MALGFTHAHNRNGSDEGRLRHKIQRLTAGLSAVLLVTAACSSPEPIAENLTPIVGGEDADIMDFPWQVSLQDPVLSEDDKPFHFCGGSIIDRFWILTAAHCVEGLEEDQLRVVAGSTKVSESDSEGQVRNVLRIVSHPEYVEASSGNDIALIRLSEPLDLSEGIGAMPIPLLAASDASRLAGSGVLARVSGWGTLESGGDSPDHLQSVELPIIPNTTAERMVRREPGYSDWRITPDQLAAGYANLGGKDACQGDSGGPLVVPNEEGTGFFLAGVVSWGIGCAEPNLPGFYARVTAFTDWIEETTQAPVVALQSPRGEVDLKGQITLSAKVASESGTIERVEFMLPNGERFVDYSEPYEMEWDTTKISDGFAVFEALVFDDQDVLGPVDLVEALILNGETCHTEVAASPTPNTIPNNGVSELVSTIEVENSDQIVGAELSLEIRHEDTLELAMWLISPSGNYHSISTRGQRDDTRISIVNQPIEGTRGELASGTWELHVVDYFAKNSAFPTDAGTLESWSLTLESACYDPGPEIPDIDIELSSTERCVGRTTPGASGWRNYKDKGLYLNVDTSHCGYTVTPQYITSMGGDGWHWTAEGATSIYFPTATGFRIYLATSFKPEEAEAKKWHINWEALPADVPVFDQCHGRTEPGQTKWLQYGTSGVYTDIDTSLCGMDEVPLYFASLGGLGSHWRVKGETAIYRQTETSFRIYLYAPGMTPEMANGLGWYINWSAALDELSSPELCTGHTERGHWKTYGSGYYVNVDTSRCGFTSTPNYFTSLQGSIHWKSQGGTAIYRPTETGFRIYVKGADARRTQVYWKASAQ